MAQTIGEAISLIQKLGQFDIGDIRMESNEKSYHHVNHKYRETIIVPYIAIEGNISFSTNKGDKYIRFADGITAKVIESYEKHICDLEEEVRSLYNIDCWSFIKRWYNANKSMSSMEFVVIKVKKEE